jgi:murein DD-endopeptidase MepM/ murein hydrolase activator NlpD
MKNIFFWLIPITLGLTIAFGTASLFFGSEKTKDGLTVLATRGNFILEKRTKFIQGTGIRNTESWDFKDSDFSQNSVSAYKYEELKYPLMIPTKGIAGHRNFLYLPDIHPGIDIWTTIDGKGLPGKNHGNPVYSACDGYVSHYKPSNEEIEIVCDKLPDIYKNMVPSLKIKTLYSHLGDGQTGASFHSLKVGDKIKKGDFMGYQGDKSSFAPENRVVHLHFGIYNMDSGKSIPPPLDPMYYIGVNTHIVGQLF